jgi:hypothetical protein
MKPFWVKKNPNNNNFYVFFSWLENVTPKRKVRLIAPLFNLGVDFKFFVGNITWF